MNKNQAYNQLVIVLTEHPVLGSLLIPYLAEEATKEGELCLLEQAFHSSPAALASMSDTEQKIIKIASHYTEKYLQEVYSKEKTSSKFIRKLTEDPAKTKKIRLFIEKKLIEMMELIRISELTIYQKQGASKLLYPHHAYRIHKEDVEIRFSFESNQQNFNYHLKCFYKNKTLPLSALKPVTVLVSNPAILLLGMEIYSFQHIEASRLLPFTKKEIISVDAALTNKYIDNILIPIAKYHEIDTIGLDIHEEKPACKCLLYVEETIYSSPLLQLKFQYDDFLFPAQSTDDTQKYISRKEQDGRSIIQYFRRDVQLERRAIDFLLQSGLEGITDSHFKLSGQALEKSLTEWISNHRDILCKEFVLTSGMQNIPYCLDEIQIEQSCSENPDWFELHITVAIGDTRIPFIHFRKHILEENREYTLPDGRIILLPEEWFSKYANLMEIGTTRGKAICLKHSHAGIAQAILEENISEKTRLLPPQYNDIQIPIGLKAQLRPYQQKGYAWMISLYQQGFGACLADDMGLGKTLQTLALLQQIYKREHNEQESNGINEKSTPSTIATTPQEELNDCKASNAEEQFDEKGQFELFGSLSIEDTLPGCIIHGKEKTIASKPSSLIVVPTSLLHNWRRETARFTTLSMMEFTGNNHYKKKDPGQLFDRYHLIFTSYGTMRNNIETLQKYRFECIVLDESQNIKNSDSLTFQAIVQLQSNHRLVLTGTPIENSLKDLWAQFYFLQPELLGNEHAFNQNFINPIKNGNSKIENRLRQLIAPFILRRNKKEVAPELPALTEEFIYCEMTENQQEIYQQEKNSLRNTLLTLRDSKQQSQHLTVLNGILRLRQLSCHPKMIFSEMEGSSGKLEQIIDTFETLRSEGHKVLIFSSFVKHLNLIADEFRQRNWPYALLTGTTDNRPEEIARFTKSDEIQAFFISLKAGGVGLNLTQADYVFIIDPWWNPAAEAQAIARAHRIGQERQVIAYRFITQGSIEEKIIQLQEGKRKLAETFIADDESIPMLSDQEWIGLLE